MAEEAFAAGNQEFVKENWKGALDFFSKAADLDNHKAEYHLHKAAALMKLNNFESAIACCEKVLSFEPSNPKAFLRKGMILVQKGDFELARQALTDGQKADPTNKSFGTWLAKCKSEGPAAAVANPQLRMCDETLTSLLELHGNQGYALAETVIEFLHRKGDFFKSPALAVDMITSLARRYAEADSDNVSRPAGGGMRTLTMTMSASAKAALDKALKDREAALAEGAASGGGPAGIKPGTQCKLNGCSVVYCDEGSLTQESLHHPGAPVFHEGYKYWSCCSRKRTTDFTEFLGYTGCTRSLCVFQEDPTKKKKALCRYDFFQQVPAEPRATQQGAQWSRMGPTVTVSIYAKKVDPEQSSVRVSATRLQLALLFDFVNTFTLDVDLAGRVDPGGCRVEILAPKVEITLRKADGSSWAELGTLLTHEDADDA